MNNSSPRALGKEEQSAPAQVEDCDESAYAISVLRVRLP
jgi:hypothetical protein